jgi:Cu/Ag efflux protein CusF
MRTFIASLLLLTLFACQSGRSHDSHEHTHDSAAPAEVEAVAPQAHATRGEIVEISESTDSQLIVVINHEAIPDFMRAMQMTFKAEKTALEGLAEGDKCSFEMRRLTAGGYEAINLVKLPDSTSLVLAD